MEHPLDTPETRATSRRRLITSLLAGGAVVAATPLLSGTARAADTPTTTVPPNRDASDNAALNAALARESRLIGTYRAAVELANEDDKVALNLILDHHVAYANALKGYLGTKAVEASETPSMQPSGGFTAMAAALANLENESAKAHADMIAGLKGIDGAALVASIVTVTVRTATALAIASGASPLAAAGA